LSFCGACSIIGMLLGSCIAFYIIIGDLSPAIISKLTGLEVSLHSHTTPLFISLILHIQSLVYSRLL